LLRSSKWSLSPGLTTWHSLLPSTRHIPRQCYSSLSDHPINILLILIGILNTTPLAFQLMILVLKPSMTVQTVDSATAVVRFQVPIQNAKCLLY
jgi:hypothetical protein